MEPAERTEEEKRILRAHEAFEEFERKSIEKGVTQGVAQVIERLFAHRLARPLEDSEKAILRTRLESLGAERLTDVVLDSTAQDLARWLADPDAR